VAAPGALFGEAAKLQQLRLTWLYFQVKLCQPSFQLFEEPFGILSMLKAGKDVKIMASTRAQPDKEKASSGAELK
jgi:hypothetical protein